MPVYVDDMYLSAIGRFGRMKMSHLVADTEAELHAMADKLGLKRSWYQYPKTPWPHYDVSMSVREKALKLGAVSITMKEAVAVCKRCRKAIKGEPNADLF